MTVDWYLREFLWYRYFVDAYNQEQRIKSSFMSGWCRQRWTTTGPQGPDANYRISWYLI